MVPPLLVAFCYSPQPSEKLHAAKRSYSFRRREPDIAVIACRFAVAIVAIRHNGHTVDPGDVPPKIAFKVLAHKVAVAASVLFGYLVLSGSIAISNFE